MARNRTTTRTPPRRRWLTYACLRILAPSLEVEDLFDMKCSFSENWWLTPVHVDGGERLKNAIFVFFFFFSS